MAVLKELIGKAATVRGCAIGRAEAAKVCALERTTAAKTCALERVEKAGGVARLWVQFARNRFNSCLIKASQARSTHKMNRRIYKMECDVKKQDYELKLKEFQQWRLDQSEIAYRDIFKRMQKLGFIDANQEFPLPLRPGLYDVKPPPLPPRKPFIQTYAAYLEDTAQVVGLIDKTIKVLVVRPAVTIGTVFCASVFALELHNEMQSPGTVREHIYAVARIARREGFVALEGSKEEKDSKLVEGSNAKEEHGSNAKKEHTDTKEKEHTDAKEKEHTDAKEKGTDVE